MGDEIKNEHKTVIMTSILQGMQAFNGGSSQTVLSLSNLLEK